MVLSTNKIEINGSKILSLSTHLIPQRNKVQSLNCYHTLKICLIRNGRGIWTIGNRDYPIEPGDIFLLNNSEHRAIHTVYPPEDLQMQVIDFEPRLIWSNHDDLLDVSFLKVFFERDKSFENRLSANHPSSAEISRLMEQIREEVSERKLQYPQMVKVKLLNILVLLNRCYFQHGQCNSGLLYSVKQSLEAVNLILRHVEEHLSEDIKLSDLAKLVHMNPSYVSRLFKKYNGLGLTQYIVRLRVQKAIEHLKENSKTVLEIALLCGFNNTSNFYKAFRNITGSSPTQYLKLMGTALL